MRRNLIVLALAGSLAAAPPSLLDTLQAFLSSIWSEAGCRLDPNGGCASPQVDEGCRLDPDGRCLAPRADEGCRLDPSGGCAALQADEGCHLDPDGRCGA